MSCLLKYRWVKLPRALVPSGKGVLGSWARLAARAAFRAGTGRYCGHMNAVTPGMWSGGIVGVKSILGVRRRAEDTRRAASARVHHLHARPRHQKTRVPHTRLGARMLRRGLLGRRGLCHGRLRLHLPAEEHHPTACRQEN